MTRNRAEYMREYRSRKKGTPGAIGQNTRADTGERVRQAYADHVAELEAEVKHLKAELANRAIKKENIPELQRRIEAAYGGPPPAGTFNSRPFTPAPKVKPHR